MYLYIYIFWYFIFHFSILDEIDSNPDLWFRLNKNIKLKQARECIAEFINADPEDVVFVQNATTGTCTFE